LLLDGWFIKVVLTTKVLLYFQVTTNKAENMSKRKSARKKKVTDASNVSSKKLSSSKVEVEPELEVEKESFACLFCTKVFCFRQRLNRYLKEHKYPGKFKFKCGFVQDFSPQRKKRMNV